MSWHCPKTIATRTMGGTLRNEKNHYGSLVHGASPSVSGAEVHVLQSHELCRRVQSQFKGRLCPGLVRRVQKYTPDSVMWSLRLSAGKQKIQNSTSAQRCVKTTSTSSYVFRRSRGTKLPSRQRYGSSELVENIAMIVNGSLGFKYTINAIHVFVCARELKGSQGTSMSLAGLSARTWLQGSQPRTHDRIRRSKNERLRFMGVVRSRLLERMHVCYGTLLLTLREQLHSALCALLV